MTGPAEQEISVDLIDAQHRLRQLDLAEADKLAVSMKGRGLINAIEVRPGEAGRYKLVAGAHRLAAAQRLGWPTIRVRIEQNNEDEARLREIDENLHRIELSPYDQANFIEERRQIWTRLYGETKRGGDRRSKAQIDPLIQALKQKGFISSTADQFGLDKNVVKRALSRKGQIDPSLWDVLRGTEAANSGVLLDKIRKLDTDLQGEVLSFFRERGCQIAEAVRVVSAEDKPDTEEAELQAAFSACRKLSPENRKKFNAWWSKQK